MQRRFAAMHTFWHFQRILPNSLYCSTSWTRKGLKLTRRALNSKHTQWQLSTMRCYETSKAHINHPWEHHIFSTPASNAPTLHLTYNRTVPIQEFAMRLGISLVWIISVRLCLFVCLLLAPVGIASNKPRFRPRLRKIFTLGQCRQRLGFSLTFKQFKLVSLASLTEWQNNRPQTSPRHFALLFSSQFYHNTKCSQWKPRGTNSKWDWIAHETYWIEFV